MTPSEYRKLAFYERVTKSKIARKDIPAAHEVIGKKKDRLQSQILNHLATPTDLDQYRDFAAGLLAQNNPEDVVAALLAHSYSDELNTQSYKNMEQVSVDTTGVSRLFIALGRAKGYDARKLVEHITQVSGVG